MATGLSAFENKARETFKNKDIKTLTNQSLLWFEKEVKRNITAANSTISKVEKFGVKNQKFQVGQLVLYKYDPKWKEELPYYDTMPLILVTKIVRNGWYGVNLHYCPPRIRTWIMSKLYENNSRRKIIERDRIAFSWQIAQQIAHAVGSTKHLEHSIKRYLTSHVKSMPLQIDPAYWDMVVHLPLARFKKGMPF